jgi:uncharacterized protein
MSGQTDLSEVLKTLKITCDNIQYGFTSVKEIHSDVEVLGTFRENEGLTVLADVSYFKKNNIQYDGPYAKLTIEVHTSLDLVGLTAVLARKLAEGNISANVVAAYYHDYIFVQYGKYKQAINLLESLKN